MSGDWYIDYLRKLEELMPESSLMLEINSFYVRNIPDNVLDNPNIHFDLDVVRPDYTMAACFITELPPKKVSFRRVKTMWDDFIPDFTPGKA